MKNAILLRSFGLMLMLLCFTLTAPPTVIAQDDNADQVRFYEAFTLELPQSDTIESPADIWVASPGTFHLAGEGYSAFDQLNIADIHIDLPASGEDKQRYRSEERIYITMHITISSEEAYDGNGIFDIDNKTTTLPVVLLE